MVGAVGVGLLATMFTPGAAQADPVNPTGPRLLAGVGSETLDPVMNGLADVVTIGGVKVIASYDGFLTSGFTSKSPAPATASSGCVYAGYVAANGPGIRATGSGAGRSRFIESLTPGNAYEGCLDFARASGINLAAATPQLTYVPFGIGAQTYAVRSDSTINRQLTVETLKTIYQCTAAPGTGTTGNFTPLLPQSGSGTRSSWLSFLGLSEATKGACVRDTWNNPSGTATDPIIEHNGKVLLNKTEIVPFDAAQYAAQSIGIITDARGKAVLGGSGSTASGTMLPAIDGSSAYTLPGGATVAQSAVVSYAVRSDSTINRQLTTATLKSIYQCSAAAGTGTTGNFTPLLPAAGSPVRSQWLAQLGLAEADLGACVRATWNNPSGTATDPIADNNGKVLLSKTELVPFSGAEYAKQTIGLVTDNRGKAVFGGQDGNPVLSANRTALGARKFYNVIPTSRVGNAAYPELNQVFVGGSSLICQATATIQKFGLDLAADCGSTTSVTA